MIINKCGNQKTIVERYVIVGHADEVTISKTNT